MKSIKQLCISLTIGISCYLTNAVEVQAQRPSLTNLVSQINTLETQVSDLEAEKAALQGPGTVAQTRSAELKGPANLPTSSFNFNSSTPPQETQGTQILSVDITPQDANSDLLVEVVVHVSESANFANVIIGAVFRDNEANAISAGWVDVDGFNSTIPALKTLTLKFNIPAVSTSASSFTLRCGAGSSSGLLIFNGISGNRNLGGTLVTSLSVTEIRN